ncbi:hypothetical protein Tco_1210814 [Tanacetum coccineum]
MLRTQMPNSLVVLNEPEGRDDYTEVTYDKEQCLSDHYPAPVTPLVYTPLVYTPSIPFLATMEPADTLLMEDEVIALAHIPSSGKTRVMETPSFSSHHMPSPRPAAYSPKELMYCNTPKNVSQRNGGWLDHESNTLFGLSRGGYAAGGVNIESLVQMMVVVNGWPEFGWRGMAAAVKVRQSGGGGRRRCVAVRDVGDRVDRVTRNNFGFGRKARRKSFPATANDGGGSGGRRRPVAAGN